LYQHSADDEEQDSITYPQLSLSSNPQ